jgi:hypothetical protein
MAMASNSETPSCPKIDMDKVNFLEKLFLSLKKQCEVKRYNFEEKLYLLNAVFQIETRLLQNLL